ncbi:hypothetical protein FKM82_011116 [Ascaphus truei]
MDIVDTFNHLIPTEHLDDALFLGSNLESEGCDEFATSQNVIEDSLKNMLSDKDPMLGSASSQFCLPVLDSADPNFQTSSSTETTRCVRPSTMETHSNPVPVTSPKKATSSRKDDQADEVNEEEDVLHSEPEQENEVKRSKRVNQTEQINISPLNSRRSSRLANQVKDDMTTDGVPKTTQKQETEEASDEIKSGLLPNMDSVIEKKDCEFETGHGDPLVLSNKNTDTVKDKEITKNEQTKSEGENSHASNVLTMPMEKVVYDTETDLSTDKKSDVIYDKVHRELALLSGAVECNLAVDTPLQSSIKSEEPESVIENPDDATVEEIHKGKCLNTSELVSIDFKNALDTKSGDLESYVKEFHDQEVLQGEEKVQITDQETSQVGEGSNTSSRERKGPKKLKSNSGKSRPQSTSSTHEKLVVTKPANINSKTQQARGKTARSHCIESEVHLREKERQRFKKIVKVRKKTAAIKDDTFSSKNKMKNKTYSVEKKIPQVHSETPQKQHHPDDVSKDMQGSLKESHHPTLAPVRSRARSLSHGSEKPCSKHPLPVSSKMSTQGKEVGEQKDAMDHFEERTKLKKSIPPHQRKSSKSMSVDEPPLFIPDNIPTVKREGAEVTSPSDNKYVWNPTKHCCSCRKLHGNRFMVGCGKCDEWFHGECVGLSLSQAQQMEADDKEYICTKCSVEEEKIETTHQGASDIHQNTDIHQEIKVVESDKTVIKSQVTGSPSLPHDKPKQMDEAIKHKVNISRKESGDGRHASDSKDPEIKKHVGSSWKTTPPSATASHRVSEEQHEKASKDSTAVPCHDEKTAKTIGLNEKQENKKKKLEKKGASHNLHPPIPPAPKPSVDQIRQSVRHSLKDILVKRLSESSSKIPEERAAKVAARIEKELFSFYRDTDSKYKNKYRSLMFNLKDPKNNILYKRVLKGEITPEHLIKMSPEELASRELAAWRQRENRHTIEMIEKEQREVERRPITKITHKGEIEIESEAPMEEPEAMDTEESVVKPVEKEEEIQKDKDEPAEFTSDTTAQHKNHLFDLNCKICTGRMAPPAEDLSPKKVQVSTGVTRKQSDNETDNIADALSSTSSILNIDVLEAEKLESPKEMFPSAISSGPSDIAEIADIVEDESAFLARISCIWKGFLNMPSVAKFVIKAYPVSGSLEHLGEDLPESIQVGGRISPQTVWDYVDKIKASGTKETCVIRFSPVTEEDQISYTLLYSYFSSRKRYGVVANNMRQVKDMYLIPLGSSEKIPHFFVPFDGPGLEMHRPNLLLALIIRQKAKRLHSTNLDDEPLGAITNVPTEKKSRIEVLNEDDDEEDDDEENDFFNSFTAVLHKNRNRQPLSDTDEPQPVIECVPEISKREPPKPLRFLPGVLVGWENQQCTLDLASRPLPVDDILQSLLGTTEHLFEHKPSVTILASTDKPLMEDKINLKEETMSSEDVPDDRVVETETSESTTEATEKPASVTALPSRTLPGFSLKRKPPDVSTETFLANINVYSNQEGIDKGPLDEPEDMKHEHEKTINPTTSPILVNSSKGSIDGINVVSSDNLADPTKSPKLMNIKRDPRQAAGRSHQGNLSEIKDYDLSKDEENPLKDNEQIGSPTLHKKTDAVKKESFKEKDVSVSKSDRPKCGLQYASSVKNELQNSETSKIKDAKPLTKDLLVEDIDPLQQFRRALAANKSQTPLASTPISESPSKNPTPAFGGNFSAVRLQQPQFLPLTGNQSIFPFQPHPNFPLQGNPMFPYPPHIPPLLPTPLGIGFPRPPRFQSAETGLLNTLVPWHPTVRLPGQPYFGQVTPGPLLGPEQAQYQGPQKFYPKDLRGPERRHSDPWDKQDQLSDRMFSRGSRSEHRQRFHSESHHSREKRQYEKESGSDKRGDKDSERSKRRDRDKERSHDRVRKSRDESHREKERSRSSHSDKSSDGKTHREGRNSDKSKSEERAHDKEREKSRDRNRDRDEEKERDRHHKNRDHSDKMKSKR